MAAQLRIGAVARSAGLTPDSVRHYERLGLLAPASRTEGGFRLYPEAALRRMQVIQAALRSGFTLKELAGIFAERRAGRAPCRRARELAAQKLQAVEAELARLAALRRALVETLADWDARLAGAPPDRPVGLLEALADSMAGVRARSNIRTRPPRRRRKEVSR